MLKNSKAVVLVLITIMSLYPLWSSSMGWALKICLISMLVVLLWLEIDWSIYREIEGTWSAPESRSKYFIQSQASFVFSICLVIAAVLMAVVSFHNP